MDDAPLWFLVFTWIWVPLWLAFLVYVNVVYWKQRSRMTQAQRNAADDEDRALFSFW